MPEIQVAQINIYPLKSAKGVSLSQQELTPRGLKHDRLWALFDVSGHVITGRTHPKLLRLSPNITADTLEIYLEGNLVLQIPIDYNLAKEAQISDVKIFS